MDEHDDVVSVVSVSTVSSVVVDQPLVAANETLMENSGCVNRDDGGDVMMEVVGSDVFIDGVGGPGEEREGFKREMESVDDDGGVIGGLESQEVGDLGGQVLETGIETPVEGVPEIAGSSDEKSRVDVEDVALRVNEEGLERGEEMVDKGSDASGVLDSHGANILSDEGWSSGIETEVGGSLKILGSCEESLDGGRVVEGVAQGLTSAEGGGGVLDDELWIPGIGATVVCSSNVAQSSSAQTPVVAEEVVTLVHDEFLIHKDEVPRSSAEEGNLTCSDNNKNLVTEPVCVGKDRDGANHSNAKPLNQQVEIAVGEEVGGINKEDILHPVANLCCSVEDQQMKVETSGANTEIQGDLHADFISSCEPTEARALSASDESLNYVEAQELKVVCVDGGSEREAALCAEPQSSSEQTKVVNDDEVSVMDNKVSNSGVEIPTTDDVDSTVACSEDNQNMKCETTFAIAGKEDHALVDLGCSNEQAHVTEIGEVAGADIEGEVKGVDAFDGICSVKGQYLEVEKLDGSCENDVAHRDLESSGTQTEIGDGSDIVVMFREVPKLEGEAMMKERDRVSSSKSEVLDDAACIQKDEELNMMKEGDRVSNSKSEVLDDTTCIQKDEELNTLTIGGSMETDGVAQGNAEASVEQIEIDDRVGSSVLDFPKIVQVPSCYASVEDISLSEKCVDLKVETLGNISVEYPSAGIDSLSTEDHNSYIQTCSDILEDNTSKQDEKQAIVVQLTDIRTHEVDGEQSMDMLIVDETLAQGVCDAELSNTVDDGTVACQATINCTVSHNEGGPVLYSISDSMGTLSDEHQNLGAHLVRSDISLLNGNQTIEVVNPAAQDESCKADEDVSEGQLLNKSVVGSLVVDLDTCINKDGKWKPQDESAKENVSLPVESQNIRDDFQLMGSNAGFDFSEGLDQSVTVDLCLGDSSVGQEVGVQELYTDAEQVDPHRGQELETWEQAADHEQAKHSDDKSSKQTTLKPGNFAKVRQVNYLLQPENEGEFSVSDLVWGKVRSHPWWPGQIFDPADASEKAMKYLKKDCFLVGYFGDRTFAWNEESLLKPFWTNFSHIEKQSNSEAFQNAVGCALEEVSRRVELGLACSCTPKDAYDRIESQIVENTGICKESSRRYGVDYSTGVSSFEPDKLVDYVRALAQFQSAGTDRLELVISKAQLLAFNRFKGYCRLPEFQICGGLLENNAGSSQLGEVIDHTPNDDQIFSSKERLKTERSSFHKRKHDLKDIVYPRKKERSLSEVMGDVASSPDGEDGSDWKASSKSVSSSSGKKRKAVDSNAHGSDVQDRRISIYAAKVSTTASPIPKPSFKVGECIRRVASQLTGPPSILKCGSGKFQKADGSSDILVGHDASLQSPSNSQRVPMEFLSLDEMLSQLQLAARDAMKGYSFLTNIHPFFSAFRNSISLGRYSGRQTSSTGKLGGGRKKKASHSIIGSPEEFDFDDVNDSYWTDMTIQNNSEDQPLGDSQNGEYEYQLMAFNPDKSLKSSPRSYSGKRFSNGNPEMDLEETIGYVDGRKQDNSPTELILNFTEGDCIPSEMNLNKIFRCFGPLKESETEVDLESSRARVVFKRVSDAEVAFGSAGKFSIFGPMIVNYQLNYSPSSFRTLPFAMQLDQEEAT